MAPPMKLAGKIFIPLMVTTCAHVAHAKDFNVTSDFSNPKNTEFADGGNCPGRLSISTVSKDPTRPKVADDFYWGQTFVEEAGCDGNKIFISINNESYLLELASHRPDSDLTFTKDIYKNKKGNIVIRIEGVRTLREDYDPDTECTTLHRLTKISIDFKNTKKIFYGISTGGCP
jgi:hypothetical protein